MKKFFNWVLILGACVGAFYLIGLIVPRNQTQASKTTLQAKPAELFAVVSDPTTWSNWNPDVSAISERSSRDHKMWSVTDKHARTYDLEVVLEEEPLSWQATYTIEGTRFVLHFDFKWYGEGSLARVTKTFDTSDTWLRAKRFLLPTPEASSVALLNALCQQVGEPGTAKEN